MDAIAAILAEIKDAIAGLLGGIAATLGVSGNPILDSLGGRIKDMVDNIVIYTRGIYQKVSQHLTDIALNIESLLVAVAHLPVDIADFAGRVADSIEGLPGGLAGAAGAAVPGLLTSILEWLVEHWELVKEVLGALIPLPDLDVIGQVFGRLRSGGGDLSDLLSPNTPREITNPLMRLIWAALFLTHLALGMGNVAAAPGIRQLEHFSNAALPTAQVGAELAARLERNGLMPLGVAQGLALEDGYDESQFTWLRIASELHFSPAQAIEVWNRMGRPEGYLDAALSAGGAAEGDKPAWEMLADVLPPPADLIRFAVKEVFNEATATLFGQFEEADRLPYDRFAQLGINEQHAREYWAAHWDLPSPQMGFEMFHRRIIDEATLKTLLKAQDYMPFWRDKMIALNYRPITRIDIRRLHKEGIYKPADVESAYLDLGYSPTNAALLRDYVIALNEQDDQELINSIRAPIRTKAVNSYLKLYSDREETAALLDKLGFEKVQIDLILATADHDRATADMDAAAAAAKQGYVSGIYDAAGVRDILAAQSFDAPAIERLLAAWDVARATRELSDAEKEQRDLTKTEILAAYNEQVLTASEAGPMLLLAGYDEHEANTLLAIEDARRARADVAALTDATRADYVSGKIERGAAGTELDRWGVAPARKVALLRKWDLERSQREAHIGVSDLANMFKAGILTADDAAAQLAIQGFGTKQIGWYLQLWSGGAAADGGRRRTNG